MNNGLRNTIQVDYQFGAFTGVSVNVSVFRNSLVAVIFVSPYYHFLHTARPGPITCREWWTVAGQDNNIRIILRSNTTNEMNDSVVGA